MIRTGARWLGVSALAAFALVTTVVAVGGPGVDRSLSAAALRYDADHPGWVAGWRVLTHTGDTLPVALAGLVLVGVLLVRRRYRQALFVAATLAIAEVPRQVLLAVLDRQRPVGAFTSTTGSSYPSGHSMHSALTALVVVVLLWHTRWRGVALGVGVGWAVLVGISRVVLGAHWPTDVVGAWLLALGAVALAAPLACERQRDGQSGGGQVDPRG